MTEGRFFESWERSPMPGRTPKTCQRWEHEFSLPVHRLDGSPKASVFAYKEELDRWLNEKLNEREVAGEKSIQVGQRRRRLLRIVLPVVLGLAATFAAVWVFIKPSARRPALGFHEITFLGNAYRHEISPDGVFLAFVTKENGGEQALMIQYYCQRRLPRDFSGAYYR